MKCADPFIMAGQAFPCGKCEPCRFNRKRIWTHRIILENLMHGDSSFITLTYQDASLPCQLNGLPTLHPKHTQTWLKRLRKQCEPSRLRFFLVGEYGDENFRPHYHAIIFGLPTCTRGRTLRQPATRSRPLWEKCCDQCRLVGSTWGHGDVDLGIVETSSAQYVCGYVTKKMTHRLDDRLRGREPEFARMSNRPGIGYDALHEFASTFLQFDLEKSQGDVPVTLRHGSRELPLGRYLRKKLRLLIGRDEKTPQQALDIIKAEMFPLQETQFATPGRTSLKSVYLEKNKGSIARFESRQRLFRQQRNI